MYTLCMHCTWCASTHTLLQQYTTRTQYATRILWCVSAQSGSSSHILPRYCVKEHFFRARASYGVLQNEMENYTSNSFHIEWDMITVTVYLSILNQMEFHSCIISNRNQIVFIIFRLIRDSKQTRLLFNQSEDSKYNLISVRFNKI